MLPLLTTVPQWHLLFTRRIWASPAVGPVSPGLLILNVSMPLPPSAVSAPGPTPDTAQSPADEFVTQHYPFLPGSQTSTPTCELLAIDTNVTVSALLGAAAALPQAGSPVMAQFEPPESLESRLSSVQLSSNYVRPDFFWCGYGGHLPFWHITGVRWWFFSDVDGHDSGFDLAWLGGWRQVLS